MKNLIQLSVTEMRAGLLAKEFTSQELTKAHLQRIADTNPTYNSFISVTEKIALDRAKRSDERLAKDGSAAPLLCGIPVAIKDALVTKGCKTTAASKILQDFVSPYDSTAAAKLNAAGAVLVGKTNMDEFAMGSSSEFSAFGPVKNPWDVSRVPGGTSGGSAVSVLLGQAPVALGTDTGGSIRQPAALCGVVGLKPTYGRVSRYGLIAHASSFDQIGPMGRTVEDVAILLAAIAGPDEQDATCMNTAVPDYVGEINRSAEAGLRGLRVRVPLVGLPCLSTGGRPPPVRSLPPPSGWSTGFWATPRDLGLRPSQRLRPAFPRFWFMWSRLDSCPIVARQVGWKRRTSPEGNWTLIQSPSRPATMHWLPALRETWPPCPGCISTL